MLAEAKNHSILAIPGALTPTELMSRSRTRRDSGQDFPLRKCGWREISEIAEGTVSEAHAYSTGGVNAANAADFIAAGAFALGVGADLVDAAALREGNLDKITNAARELVNAVTSARAALKAKKAS